MKKILLFSLVILCFSQTNAQTWNQVKKMVASDRKSGDQFGRSVSVSGNYALVGAAMVGGPQFGGAAYFYEKDAAGNWIEVQKVRSTDLDFGDQFGTSVSISGNYAVVGAFQEDHDVFGGNMKLQSGAAYIYERDAGGIWNEVQKIVAPDRNTNDFFATSVSISGNYLIAGAPSESEDAAGGNTIMGAGSVYMFERDAGGNWNFVQKNVASDRAFNDWFGYTVSLDGTYAVVGALWEDDDVTGGNAMTDAGSAYVFERDAGGNWNQVQKIVASDRADYDNFACSVSIKSDYLIVGSIYQDEDSLGGNAITNAGSSYIFKRDVVGNWNQEQKIVASDRDSSDSFGHSVAIDGSHVIVGAYHEEHNALGGDSLYHAGSAYIFERDGGGNWNEQQKIVASDRETDDRYGGAVSINGNYAFVGVWYEDENAVGVDSLPDAGSAYVYALCTTGSTASNVSVIACNNYLSPSGNYTWTTSGTYIDSIYNSGGCDSVITINLTINLVDTSVTTAGPLLTSNATGVTYQWLDCNNNYMPINGETAQSYTATSNGHYAVVVSQNGCSDTSACYKVINVGMVENSFGSNLNIYPNPTTKAVNLDLGKKYNEVQLTVTNVIGQEIFTKNYQSSQFIHLEISAPKGMYLLEVLLEKGESHVFRLIKN
jgi:hypothetical protein